MTTNKTKKNNASTTNATNKEDKKMSNAKKPENTKPATKPTDKSVDKRESVRAAVDKWLAQFKQEATSNGMTVEVKTWEKIPTCRSLKVDGVTYFEIYYSARGARLNAKSKLIPEALRPAGSNIIQNGLDLTIPTFTEIAENLTKYADACRHSIAVAKAEKEAKKTKDAKKEPAKAEAK